jgi:hypothetical protein
MIRKLFLGALVVLVLPLASAQAGVRIGVSIVPPPYRPFYYGPYYRPVYVQPAPVYVQPAPVLSPRPLPPPQPIPQN